MQHNFVCLPYLNLGNTHEIDFGFAKIWNFNLQKEKYILDKRLREQVGKILSSYKSPYPQGGKGLEFYPPIQGIGLISTSAATEKELDNSEKQKINDARLILFISQIAHCNTITKNYNSGHKMASSENYIPIFFSTSIDAEFMTENGGIVIPYAHHGIRIDKNIFIRPRHIPTPAFDFDKDLFNSLIKVRLKHKRVFRRLLSAIEIFYESYYNTPEVSQNARILLQASAFEILFGFNEQEARRGVKNFLRENANYPEDSLYHYNSERKGGRMECEEDTKKVIWADRFFTLRNHIVHGHTPKKKEYYFNEWQSHFDIALYFFVFCLKRKLEEIMDKEIFGDDVEWKTWDDNLMIPVKKFTGFVYNPMGRRWWERMNRNLP